MGQAFPHGYALLVGVGATAYSPWSLPVTVKDVQAVRRVLTNSELCGYIEDDKHIRVLHDKTATKGAILDGLNWLKDRVASDSEGTAFVFYSGHGWLDQASGHYFLIPHDVTPYNITDSAIIDRDFTNALREVRARRLLVIIDTCHAEGMATSKAAESPVDLPGRMTQAAVTESNGLLEALKQGEGRAVFTSSRGRQFSWVRSDGSLSVFTHHLLEALQGAGSNAGEAEVRISNLMGHLGRAVPASARQMHSADQVPFFDTATEDFTVALLRGGKGLPAGGWAAVKPETEEFIRQVVNIVASGERAVVIGGSVTGSTIITGDRHIEKNNTN